MKVYFKILICCNIENSDFSQLIKFIYQKDLFSIQRYLVIEGFVYYFSDNRNFFQFLTKLDFTGENFQA